MEKLKVKNISNEIIDIGYSRDGDAGIDLRASGIWTVKLDQIENEEINSESYFIEPGERILVKTGIKVAIPKNHYGHIKDRSGLALKNGIHVLAGVIDENYRNEIGVVLINLGSKMYKISKNEKIAQMIIKKYEKMDIEYVNELDETNRNLSGFGSSGKF